MTRYGFALAALASAATMSHGAHAASVDLINPLSLSTDSTDDLETYLTSDFPGIHFPFVLEGNGIAYAERFAGQTLVESGAFDIVTGLPFGPLELVVGDTNDNITVYNQGGSSVLGGNGPVGFPDQSSLGEGSVAMLFDIDQMEFGLDFVGTNGGTASVDVFRRDGSLLDSMTVLLDADGSYAFRTSDLAYEVAGVVITNDDASGVVLDNIRYSINPVPGPGTLALLAAAGLAGRRRRLA